MKTKILLIIAVGFICSISTVQANDILIPAELASEKSTGVNLRDSSWSDLAVLHGETGFIEWSINIEKAGDFFVHFLYASGQPRPAELKIDGTVIKGKIFQKSTGGFHSPDLALETVGPFTFDAGKHSIRLTTVNYMPHFRGFVVSTNQTPPSKDVFEEENRKREAAIFAELAPKMLETREKVQRLLQADSIVFVKRKTFQSSHYYTDFIDGCVHFGSDLCLLSLKDGSVKELAPQLKDGIIGRCNLSFDAKKVVFDYKRKIGEGFRIWEVGIDGTGLRQLTFPPEDEAERIAKYRQHYHSMYHHHTDDLHPCYLPDGGVTFVSTRCEYGILCDGPDILTTSVLYRMDMDGKNIEKLSNNSVSESVPSIMNDGRILYTRWEYVDNGAVTNKGLWTVRPDGTGSNEVYGANIIFPSVFNVARAVPGSNDHFVCIGAPHMPLGVGTVMMIDTRLDRRTGDPVTYLTPETDTQHQWGWDNIEGGAVKPFQPPGLIHRSYNWDGTGNTDKGPLFMDPFPINMEQIIVSFNPNKPWNAVDAYSLYLIDASGKREILHAEPGISCWSAIPVTVREMPGIPRGTIDETLAKQGLAQVVVSDIYRGLDGVEKGTIKFIRVNEHVPRPWSARRFWEHGDDDCVDQQHSVISLNTHLGLKLQDGIVPVEEDGSANFFVRADKNIFLQVLDENYMEVQRERTFVNYRPGEVRACVGCHERTGDISVTQSRLPLAVQRKPDVPGPQPGETSGAKPLHYPTDVQPVLDKHCVSCHGNENPKGNLVLTGELTPHFSRSYEELLKRNTFIVIGENHPKAGNNHYLPPKILGSWAAPLAKRITDKTSPCFTNMTPEERIRITTWIDSNGQYYGTYYGKKHIRFEKDPDFRITPKHE